MADTLSVLEAILRDASGFAALALHEARPGLLALKLALSVCLLCMAYGFSMGLASGMKQAVSSLVKLPLLFLLTLALCFPALFIIGMFMGSPLSCVQTLTLVLSAIALQAMLFGASAPIVLFFAIGSGYDFMKLLHVAILGVSGLCGLVFLHHAMRVALGPGFGSTHVLFFVWFMIDGFVGCQMAWMLRPFLGDPHLKYQWFRTRGGEMNFYLAVLASARALLVKTPDDRPSIVAPQNAPEASAR